ncbi:hypothetical protein TEA_011456 [Camellia sinensis var. sinensis]|uniref:Retrotransposon gag domain-containing protein n=1 Tax=Camellia sinensis var. sinensis TaxID=542762 RepID=A0A4S4EMT7_CAMSN|nr:hypothetical protein TEA_011456 [Camellia sinensis var. sinensis]
MADEWLEQMSKTFEMLGIEDGALKVTLASFQLKGDAGQWWKYEKARVGGTWEAFVNAFQERFLSAAARNSKDHQAIDILLAEIDIYKLFAFKHCKGRKVKLALCEEITCSSEHNRIQRLPGSRLINPGCIFQEVKVEHHHPYQELMFGLKGIQTRKEGKSMNEVLDATVGSNPSQRSSDLLQSTPHDNLPTLVNEVGSVTESIEAMKLSKRAGSSIANLPTGLDMEEEIFRQKQQKAKAEINSKNALS